MDSFCERESVSNLMEWRGEIRVNDGQKMEQNGVCNGMDPRWRLVSVMDRKWSVIGCV